MDSVQLERLSRTPIVTSTHIPGSNTVFNPAASLTPDGTVLLARVEDRRGLSALHVLRSADGIGGWSADSQPLLTPDPDDPVCEWGFEDARTTWVEELDQFVITCTAYGRGGPCVYVATTKDFSTVDQLGVALPPEDKNAALFPRRIDGSWRLLHRPVAVATGGADIWMSTSDDLVAWRDARPLMERRAGMWDAHRIGSGPPPIETAAGWLLIYHGVRNTVAGGMYRVGAALLDLDDPTIVLVRHRDWLFSPTELWERVGDVPNVVFPCGATVVDGQLRLYYGAADTSIGVAGCDLDALVESLVASADATT